VERALRVMHQQRQPSVQLWLLQERDFAECHG